MSGISAIASPLFVCVCVCVCVCGLLLLSGTTCIFISFSISPSLYLSLPPSLSPSLPPSFPSLPSSLLKIICNTHLLLSISPSPPLPFPLSSAGPCMLICQWGWCSAGWLHYAGYRSCPQRCLHSSAPLLSAHALLKPVLRKAYNGRWWADDQEWCVAALPCVEFESSSSSHHQVDQQWRPCYLHPECREMGYKIDLIATEYT